MQLLPASLLAMLPLALASPMPPLENRDATPGCTKASFGNFSWTVDSFDYHASYVFTTPAHQNSGGYVSFNLSNPALPYPAVCSGASSQLNDFFYGNLWYTCKVPSGSSTDSSTSFTFDRSSGQLNFNQTWSCSDVDPQYPTTFNGYAAVNLTLDCTDTTWTNPNWTMGQTYSERDVKCSPVTLSVKPFKMTAIA